MVELYCPYCGEPKRDKISCCGEVHFGTWEECGFEDCDTEPPDQTERVNEHISAA